MESVLVKADDRVKKGQGFDLRSVSVELMEVAKAYIEKVDAEDPVDRIEGHRFLLRMLSTAINARVNYDVDRPSFFHFITPHFKMYLDSPDTDYQRCNISLSQKRVYKITAHIPENLVYYGMQLYGPSGRIGNGLSDNDMKPHPETRKLILFVAASSTDLKGVLEKNGIQSKHEGKESERTPVVILVGEEDDLVLVARQYFTNRKIEPRLKWNVELIHRQQNVEFPKYSTQAQGKSIALGGIVSQMALNLNTAQHEARKRLSQVEATLTPAEKEDEEMLWAQRVAEARKGFEELLDSTIHAHQMIQHLPANEMIPIGVGTRLCPTPDNRYTLARASLRPGRMLVLRGSRRPNCRYFSVCLVNKWLESLDYLRHRIYVNHEQIQWEKDGSFEVCISLHHLDHPNHLYADRHNELLILVRELLPEDDEPLLYTLEDSVAPESWIRQELKARL
eukprot:TRINITY_DN3658_c0_g3_i3.p1 TRINITY_DN3658_c0_g3~~TRINITY_DN3658_c0_g3_i3.p1  ORF type:complete len:450 (-),score=71.74 TRINITY_DN3658_c0_g3_i3:59-1408(-)